MKKSSTFRALSAEVGSLRPTLRKQYFSPDSPVPSGDLSFRYRLNGAADPTARAKELPPMSSSVVPAYGTARGGVKRVPGTMQRCIAVEELCSREMAGKRMCGRDIMQREYYAVRNYAVEIRCRRNCMQ